MPRRVIDLSQPLSRESQLHPFFPPTQILRHIQHSDAALGDPSFSAEIIITSNHAATHVDAFGHYQPGGASLQEMPLDTFCGEAICVGGKNGWSCDSRESGWERSITRRGIGAPFDRRRWCERV